MGNKAYDKGRRKEYNMVHVLKKKGWIAQRTAGSHSFFDIIAVHKKDRKILLLQAKPDTMSDAVKYKLEDEYWWVNGGFEVRFKVV